MEAGSEEEVVTLPDKMPIVTVGRTWEDLDNLDISKLKGLLADIEDPRVTRNTILRNGWSAGDFAIAYLRLIWRRKRGRDTYVRKSTGALKHVRLGQGSQ